MQDVLSWLADAARGSAGRLISVAVSLGVVLLLVRWARRGAASTIDDATVRYHVRKVIAVVGGLFAALIVGIAFSSALAGLPLVLGVTAAGIALALQDAIASVAGWMAIASGTTFRPGDRVELGGVRGDVIDIGVFRTTLMEIGKWVDGDLYNGRIVRVANSAVFKQPVFNYTADFPFVWDEIKIPIRYGSDRARARAVLQVAAAEIAGPYAEGARERWGQLVKRFMIEDAQVTPMVTLVATDNWLEFTVRYAVDTKLRRTTQDRLFERILTDIDATDGAVVIASATLQLMTSPTPAPARTAAPKAVA